MIKKLKIFVSVLSLIITIGIISAFVTEINFARASAPSGLQTTVATSTAYVISTTAKTIFATSTNCSSRIITTTTNPIMLTFSDNQGKVPTATYGHLQSASTTIAYDSGIYGCNAYKAYGFDTSSNLTLTETR